MPAKVVIRVFFPNGLFKTASIDWSVTVEELISIIGKKLSLEYSSELDLTKCELYECQVETCGSSGEDGTSSSSSAPTSISSRAIWLEKPFGTTKHKLSSCDRPFPYVQSWISKNIASRCRFVMDYVPPASATASPISVASPAATAGAAGNGNEGAYGRNSSIFSVPPDMAAAATTTTTPSTQPQPIVSTSPPPPSSTASSTTAAPSPQSPQQTPKTQQSGGGGWHTYTCTRKRPDNVSEALASIGITERSTSPSPVPPQSPGVPAILVAATAAASETGAKSESGNGSAAKTSVEEKDDNESDADKAMKSALGTEWFGADGSSTKDGWSNDDRKPIPEQLITEALLPSTSPELPSCPAPAIPSDDNPQERYIAFLNKYLSGSGLSVKALDDLGSGVLVIRALEAMLSKSVFVNLLVICD